MNRKILIAAALVASSVYMACGGGGGDSEGAKSPEPAMSAAPMPTPAPTPEPVAVAPTASATTPPPEPPKSLYDRIGGKDAIGKVVDSALGIITGDKRISKYFAKTVKDKKKVEALRNNLVDQICQATGGPCEYKGKDMKTTHKGMKVTDDAFSAFMEDIGKALDGAGVGSKEKDELTTALLSMKGDIVEAAPEKPAAKPAAKPAGSAKPAATPASKGGKK